MCFRVLMDTVRQQRLSRHLNGRSKKRRRGLSALMLKEIMEQPRVIEDALLAGDSRKALRRRLGGLTSVDKALEDSLISVRFVRNITSCGDGGRISSGRYCWEICQGDTCFGIRYKNPVLDAETALIALSQSGETADTLAAVEEAQRKGALALGIVNVVGSTIARKTDAGIYTHAGPEISVASTKAFTSQLAVLSLLALSLGRRGTLSLVAGKDFARHLRQIPDKIQQIFTQTDAIRSVAERFSHCKDFFYLGRRYSAPVAFEGALKIKKSLMCMPKPIRQER